MALHLRTGLVLATDPDGEANGPKLWALDSAREWNEQIEGLAQQIKCLLDTKEVQEALHLGSTHRP